MLMMNTRPLLPGLTWSNTRVGFSGPSLSHQYHIRSTITTSSSNVMVNASLSSAGDVSGRRVGVVVVDHGSKRAAANDMLDGVVEMYQNMIEEGDVVCVTKAHMELASPSIRDAVKVCVCEHGADVVVVAPFFLSRGRHIQEDIPRLVREAEAEMCGEKSVQCIVAEPLGLDAGVVAVMKKRVDDALQSSVE